MVEDVSDRVARAWILPEGQPLEAAEVAFPADLAVLKIGWQLDNLGLDPAED